MKWLLLRFIRLYTQDSGLEGFVWGLLWGAILTQLAILPALFIDAWIRR